MCIHSAPASSIGRAEVRKTHIQYKTLWEWFGRQEGGRAGEVLPPAQKTKKNEVKNSFSIAECGKKHANNNKGPGIRANPAKSEAIRHIYMLWIRLLGNTGQILRSPR